MTQEVLPEIQVATEAIESRIAITEGEVAQMNEGIAAKRELLRSQRKALTTINPKRAAIKKRGTGNQRKAAASVSNQSDYAVAGPEAIYAHGIIALRATGRLPVIEHVSKWPTTFDFFST